MKLRSNDPLTTLAKNKNIDTWEKLIVHVQSLPYGRNANRTDFSLVLSEGKGTCSSKHALLKQIADANHIPDVKLILGIYKMNQQNTPKIGDELINNSLEYLPEAHCYLKINNQRFDFTTMKSSIENIENEIIEEREINAHQVADFKVDYHKGFIRKWMKSRNISLSFAEIWVIWERCIENLTRL
jgi:hypothetical protein